MTKQQLFKLLKRRIEVSRFEAHVRRDLLQRLNKLHRRVKGQIGGVEVDNIGKRELNRLLKDIDELSNETHTELVALMTAYSLDLIDDEADFVRREMDWQAQHHKALGAGQAPEKTPDFMPLVLGATISEWLSKQSRDYVHSVKMAVRTGGALDHLPRWLGNQTKSFTVTWANATSQQTQRKLAAKSKGFSEYQHNSLLDSKTSDMCIVRHLKRWTADKEPIDHDLQYEEPPLHRHCRSFMTFEFDFYDSSEIDDVTADEWLDSMSEKEQNRTLGVGKAAMYRRGDITLRDLLDQSGRPKPLYRLQAELDSSTVSPMIKMHRSPWRNNFPDTIIDRPLGDATKHPLYEKAKAGDTKSAYLLAKDLVSDEAVEKIRKLKGDKSIVIVPVHAEEAIGKNKIPVAVSAILADRLGVSFNTDIVQATKVSRTNKDGWYRLANPPMFAGKLQKDSLTLLVDDTQTQGGTFAALKGHIESNDSRVIGAYALTGKQYSVQLRLSEETLGKLRDEYSSIETWWRKEFGYGFDRLTEWEARYLIKSGKSPDEVRDTILTRRLKESK